MIVKKWEPFISCAEAAEIAHRTKSWVREQAVCGRVGTLASRKRGRLVNRNDICRLVLQRPNLTDDERFAALEEMIARDRTDEEQGEHDFLSTIRSSMTPTNAVHAADVLSETFGPVEDYVDKDVKVAIADEAKNIVAGARRSAYGKPENNFARIAALWTGYAKAKGWPIEFAAADISPLMRLMKEARIVESPDHRDSHVDLIGYALTGAEVNGVKA